jgi:hypothetical protein
MTNPPWTHPEPQPPDFDGDIATIDAHFVEEHRRTLTAKLRIVLTIEGDAERLDRLCPPGRETSRRCRRASAKRCRPPHSNP